MVTEPKVGSIHQSLLNRQSRDTYQVPTIYTHQTGLLINRAFNKSAGTAIINHVSSILLAGFNCGIMHTSNDFSRAVDKTCEDSMKLTFC